MDTMARLEADRFVAAAEVAGRLTANIGSVVHGKDDEIRLVIAALACEGHVLFEDVPGTAKTVLARAIAASIDGAQFARIQCTPDLQPTDVTGLSIFNQKTRDFEFRPGPVFANVLLVDEINRAMPKTQSALLEAMAERQVTADGETRILPDPFLLLATENPIEHEGTFPLPEAQLDRFFLRTTLGYPGEDDELRILGDQRAGHPLKHLRPTVTLDEIKILQAAVCATLRRRADPAVDRRASSARLASSRAWQSARRCAARWPSSTPHARGRCSRAAHSSCPKMSTGCPCPCSPTASSSRSSSRPMRGGPAGRLRSSTSATKCSPARPGRRCTTAKSPPSTAMGAGRPRVTAPEAVFPLVVRHRPIGVAFGTTPSARRGIGADIAGSRPYRAGDDIRGIDWAASARLSASRAEDAFIVRERFAEESPCAVVVTDRRPSMALYPDGLPWLRKPEVMRVATDLIVASARRARAAIGSLEFGAGDPEPDWRPPSVSGRWNLAEPVVGAPFAAPEDNLGLALHHLCLLRGALPRGSFVFVLSDFLTCPPDEVWLAAVERRWTSSPS